MGRKALLAALCLCLPWATAVGDEHGKSRPVPTWGGGTGRVSLGPSPDRGRGGVGEPRGMPAAVGRGLRGALLLHGGKWGWRGLLEDLRPPGTDLDTVPLPGAQQGLSSGMAWPAEVWDVLGFFPPGERCLLKIPFWRQVGTALASW